MGKRRGISIKLDINSGTLEKVQELWNKFIKITGLSENQIEGIMFNINSTKKCANYLITERLSSNKLGLELDRANNIISKLDEDAGYCIMRIPERGWRHKKINIDNSEYISELNNDNIKFRVERINAIDNTMSIRTTTVGNR